jgi:hypothetical protein
LRRTLDERSLVGEVRITNASDGPELLMSPRLIMNIFLLRWKILHHEQRNSQGDEVHDQECQHMCRGLVSTHDLPHSSPVTNRPVFFDSRHFIRHGTLSTQPVECRQAPASKRKLKPRLRDGPRALRTHKPLPSGPELPFCEICKILLGGDAKPYQKSTRWERLTADREGFA